MRIPAPLSLIVLIVLITADSPSASARQGTLERSILGTVVEQQEKSETKERTVVAEIKLDAPVDGVELELPKELVDAAKLVELAGWQAVKGEGGITWTSERPVNLVRLRIDLPATLADKLDKALVNGLKLKFKLGEEAIGTQSFNVKKTDSPGTITEPAEVGLPPRVYEGLNSFLPPDGYTNGENGTWSARVKTDSGTEELPVSPVLTREELMVGVDYRLKNPLDTTNLTFPGRAGRPKDPFHDPTPPLGFLVPPNLPPGTAVEITYVDRFGNTVVGARVSADSFEDRGLPPFLITCTPKIFAGDYLCVCGYFPTQFSRNQLLLDGKPLGKLAGSKDTILFQPKGLRPGPHVIEWNVKAFSDPFDPAVEGRQPPSNLDEVAFVLLEVKGAIDQNSLYTGQGTTLRLRITGSEEQLPIELTNKTPQIIDMEGGVSQVIKSSGGANNVVERRVKGTLRGNFNITYRLALPPCPCAAGQTAQFSEVLGQVQASEQTPSATQTAGTQTTAQSNKCEMIFQECTKAEAEVYQLESEFKKAFDGCSKGRGANDLKFYTDCIKRTRERYRQKLGEAYLKEVTCYESWQECVKSQEAAKPSGARSVATSPSQPEPSVALETGPLTSVPAPPTNAGEQQTPQRPESRETCDALERQCELIAGEGRSLSSQKKGFEALCERFNSDEQALKNCKRQVEERFQPKIQAASQKLRECRERLARCRENQAGQ